MASAAPKLILSPSRDIPFNKLVLSQSNVRRTKCGVSIGELAEDIVRRTLLNSLNVRAVLDAEGKETGMFEVPAGGRRFRALELLVKTKRMAKTQAVPCVVREAGDVSAEEDSLAENIQRQQLHPLDQFRAMQLLVDQGSGVEEIAARFMTTPGIVRQRLRLANVSPVLHEVYADDGMTLEQLMAFSVSEDHARQEQVWEMIAHSHIREPYFIRRKLTEDTVRASDRRVRFVGIDAYVAAGGAMLRDLFEADDGGWVQDAALLDRLVDEKLKAAAEEVGTEGWKWVTAAIDLPYRCTDGMRELDGEAPPTSESEQARIAQLHAEAEAIEAEFEAADDMPEDVDQRITAIDEELAGLVERPLVYDPAEMARAGVLVSIDSVGSLYILRGFVRPEDEPQADTGHEQGEGRDGSHLPDTGAASTLGINSGVQTALVTVGAAQAPEPIEDEDDEIIKPLPDRLVSELTAHRTLALQDAFAASPSTAFAAVLHALVLSTFYHGRTESCLGLSVNHVGFPHQPPGMKDSPSAKAISARQADWKNRLPQSDKDLWEALLHLDGADQATLFAHCASFAVNALWEPTSRYDGRVSAHMVQRRIEHSHVLARAVGLDMVAAGWKPTVDTYLARVTKPRILMAVAEAKGEQTAGLIDHLKKGDMAKEAERLLDDSGWLPEPLRTPVIDDLLAMSGDKPDVDGREESNGLPAFLDEEGDGTADDEEDLPDSYAIAAE
jgi:ParB family chromosome partitioning protein